VTPEQYAVSQAAITAGLAAYVQRVGALFKGPGLSLRDWLGFLEFIFPEVQRRYELSASLGRDFYDSQRRQHHPLLERNEMLLSELRFEQFVENMAPAKKAMSQADSPNVAVTKAALTAVREVEMAARRQIIGAVKNDPVVEKIVEQANDTAAPVEPTPQKKPAENVVESQLKKPSDAVSAARAKAARASEPGSELLAQVEKNLAKLQFDKKVSEPDVSAPTSGAVIGWARIATGNETCAWCLMLISRGAELNHKKNFAYREAATAGINLDDGTALGLWEAAGGDVNKFRELLYDEEDDESFMERWHTGCDCLAVPVFDINDWPGRDQAKRAMQLWIDASGTAADLIESGKSRTKNKYTETLNALRRRLERGDISMSNYAIAA